jgi:predicted alpha/beta superfamily hydrolase
LNSLQVQQLQELKAVGNEIGYHSANHIYAVQYLNDGYTVEDYLNTEILTVMGQLTS